MITPKESVFDRLGQSVEIYKNNFLPLLLIFTVYTFLYTVVFTNLLNITTFGNIDFGSFNKENFATLFQDSSFVYGVALSITGLLIYLMFLIPVTLGTYRGIKQAISGEKVLVKENLLYGFKNFINSFSTYWYIFVYVALLPAILFIVGGLILLIGLTSGDTSSVFTTIGGITITISVIIFVIFAMYRGTKSSFAIYSAVDSNSYTKENFLKSVKITNNNRWRIVGNGILVGFIISFISGIVSFMFSIFSVATSGVDFVGIAQNVDNLNEESIKDIAGQLGGTPIVNIIISTIKTVIESIFTVFAFVFMYLLFKRLELESISVTKKVDVIKENKSKNLENKEEL